MSVRFQKVHPYDRALMVSAFKLRYHVYCLECGFENPENYPDEMEQDTYDSSSVHFVAVNDHDKVIGTIRLIRYSQLGFPLEKHCPVAIKKNDCNPAGMAEISRLAVDRKWRSPEVTLGLWREVYQASKRAGILYWYAAMERKLDRLLRKFHLPFEQVGAMMDYNGSRAPYMGRVDTLERTLALKEPDLYHYFREGLENRKDTTGPDIPYPLFTAL